MPEAIPAALHHKVIDPAGTIIPTLISTVPCDAVISFGKRAGSQVPYQLAPAIIDSEADI